MIAPVTLGTRRSTESAPNTQKKALWTLRAQRVLRLASWTILAVVLDGKCGSAHDFERTQVTLTLARDGAFVLDVANDAAWLQHRLIPFDGPFADRVVLFVDGREVRPASIEYIAGPPPLAVYRMRGRIPLDAHSLRWYYGLPIDPYPLTVRRADGRIIVEEIAGDAWSRPIDLAGQFRAPRVSSRTVALAIAALLFVPVAVRFTAKLTKVRKSRKEMFFFVCFVCFVFRVFRVLRG
jgi:hypothetical protein